MKPVKVRWTCAAGADALDDLLAEVAAFGEVEGAGLVGFLREVFVADVGAVEGCAGEDAEVFEVDGRGGDCAGCDEGVGDGAELVLRRTRFRNAGRRGFRRG